MTNRKRIVNDIRRKIIVGRYQPGSAIPSFSRLAEIYGVSVSAQRAVVSLRDQGLVIGRPGRGVFVADR